MPAFWKELAGGTVGGVIGLAVVYPLDTVKSRLQTSGRARYTGTVHVLTSMARKEGVLSLYRGLLSPIAGAGLTFALSFSSYGLACRSLLRRRGAEDLDRDRLTLSEMTLAGTFAGLVNSPLKQVIERVKNVMQVRLGREHKAPYSWSGACAADLVRREGVVRGLFVGMGTTTLREGVQCSIYYPTYALMKAYLISGNQASRGKVPDAVIHMLAGGLAGCVTWLPPVYSLDVVKTRVQTALPGTYRGPWDCAVKIWSAEGAQPFVRGVGPALARAFPHHALVFLGYETTLLLLSGRPLSATRQGHH